MTTASHFELWFEPKPKDKETMTQVFYRSLDIGNACLNHTDSVSILMIKKVHYVSSVRTGDI